jgi:hypothetical protein
MTDIPCARYDKRCRKFNSSTMVINSFGLYSRRRRMGYVQHLVLGCKPLRDAPGIGIYIGLIVINPFTWFDVIGWTYCDLRDPAKYLHKKLSNLSRHNKFLNLLPKLNNFGKLSQLFRHDRLIKKTFLLHGKTGKFSKTSK